jgi:hypothetical protein
MYGDFDMNTLAKALMTKTDASGLDFHDVSQFTATDVREAISALVAEDKLPLADALCEAGLSLHPRDENILSMAALMANLHQDWERAESYIRELMDVQGGKATEFTWNLLIRVLRCQAEPIEALSAARAALLQHPTNSDLLREVKELEEFFGDAAVFVQPSGTWQ